MATEAALSARFAALGDPTRRAIVSRLTRGEATVGELTAPLPISQPAVSRHLRVLEQAGLIVRRIDGPRRPCRLAPKALGDLEQFLAMLQQAMEHNYTRLDRVLAKENDP